MMKAGRILTTMAGALVCLCALWWWPVYAQEKAETPPAPQTTVPDMAADLDILLPPAGLTFTPAIGHWLEYRYTAKGATQPRSFILAAVGRTSYRGRIATWLEIKTESRNQTPVVLHVLVAFSPNAGQTEIKRLVVRTGDFHAVEYPLDTLPAPKPINPRSLWVELPEETVTVEAGEFAAQVYRREKPNGEVQTLWFSPSLAPFGLLRTRSTAGELELIDYGDDYRATALPEPTILAPRDAETPVGTP